MLCQHRAWRGVVAVGIVQLLTAQLGGKSTHAPSIGHSSMEVSPHKACPPIYQKQVDRQHLQDLQSQRVSTETARCSLQRRAFRTGWTLAPPEAVQYLPKAKVQALRKPWGERGSAPHDARSGEQRLHPLSGSPTARPTRL